MSLRLNGLLAAALLGLAACDGAGTAAPQAEGSEAYLDASGGGDDMVQVPSADAEMNAAVAEAKRTLPVYLARLDAGQLAPSDGVKVAMPTDQGNEHIWVHQVARDGDRLTGVLANQPNYLPNLQRGSPVTFAVDQVSDWSYEKDGRMWGNYTTRVMLPHVGPEDQASLRQSLSATPTETPVP